MSFRAELLKLRKRPAVLFLGLLWFTVFTLFAYFLPYFEPSASVTSSLLPGNLIENVLSGFPVLGGALGLVFGALTVGSEYGWQTFKTAFTERPGRLSVFFGKVLATSIFLITLVLTVFVSGALYSYAVARLNGAAVHWPSKTELILGFCAGWLILVTYALFGMLLATLFRSTALAIGVGLIYVFIVEGPLSQFPTQAGLLNYVQNILLGRNAQILTGGAPSTETTYAALLMVTYALLFGSLATLVLLKRDITD